MLNPYAEAQGPFVEVLHPFFAAQCLSGLFQYPCTESAAAVEDNLSGNIKVKLSIAHEEEVKAIIDFSRRFLKGRSIEKHALDLTIANV